MLTRAKMQERKHNGNEMTSLPSLMPSMCVPIFTDTASA